MSHLFPKILLLHSSKSMALYVAATTATVVLVYIDWERRIAGAVAAVVGPQSRRPKPSSLQSQRPKVACSSRSIAVTTALRLILSRYNDASDASRAPDERSRAGSGDRSRDARPKTRRPEKRRASGDLHEMVKYSYPGNPAILGKQPMFHFQAIRQWTFD